MDWDFQGLKSAVNVNGVLNPKPKIQNPKSGTGWTVELAFPWSGMKHLAGKRALPPKDGDVWKLFLGRFEKLPVGENEVQAAWCWSDGCNGRTLQTER